QANEPVGQLAPDRGDAEQARQLRVVDEPLRVPRGPVAIVALHDFEHDVVGLSGRVQDLRDPADGIVHAHPSFRIARAGPPSPSRILSGRTVRWYRPASTCPRSSPSTITTPPSRSAWCTGWPGAPRCSTERKSTPISRRPRSSTHAALSGVRHAEPTGKAISR